MFKTGERAPDRADWKLIGLGLFLAGLFFLGDLLVPLGVAGGVLYVAVVLLAQWSPDWRHIHWAAALGTILTLLGYVLSPEGGIAWVVLTNRALAVFAIWVTALLLYDRKRIEKRLSIQESRARIDEAVRESEKLGDKVLRESEERFRAFFHDAPLAYQSLDQSGNFLEVNDTWCEVLGYSHSEIIGMNFSDIIAPADVSQFLYSFPCFKNDGEIHDVEFELVRKDGGHVHVSFDGKIARHRDGSFKQTHCILNDITDRKRAEEALRRREHELRSITDNIPALVSYIDPDGRYQFVNKGYEEMFGLPREQIVGRRLREFMDEGEYARVEKNIEQALAGKRVTSEYSVRVGDEVRWFASNFIPDFGDDGEFRGFFAMIRDISDRKRMEEEKSDLEARLREAAKMEAIGRLAGGIAHDFNNILTGIQNYTELAQEEAPAGSRQRDDLDQVLRATARATEVIDQILAFSRGGRKDLTCIEWSGVIEEALKLVQPSVPSVIELRCRIETDSSAIMGDATQLHEAILNLCTNAVSAIGDHEGIVDVALEEIEIGPEESVSFPELKPGPHYRLTVRDTGHGIAPEIIDRVFEPFFTTHDVGMGTGMGLALVHSIVLGHDGAIRLESTPDEGTAVSLYLRRSDARPEPSDAGPEPKAEAIEGSERILIVDDEDMIVNSMGRILTKLGYEVIGSTSALEALELFRSSPNAFDLVITDLTMPKMTGDVLASEILRLRPDIPVVLCSGFIDDADEKQVQLNGIRLKLKKPLSAKLLGETVRAVFDGQRVGAA